MDTLQPERPAVPAHRTETPRQGALPCQQGTAPLCHTIVCMFFYLQFDFCFLGADDNTDDSQCRMGFRRVSGSYVHTISSIQYSDFA